MATTENPARIPVTILLGFVLILFFILCNITSINPGKQNKDIPNNKALFFNSILKIFNIMNREKIPIIIPVHLQQRGKTKFPICGALSARLLHKGIIPMLSQAN